MTDLVDIDSRVIERVLEHEHEVRRRLSARRLVPRVSSGEAIPGSDDELCGASGADSVDGCLVVREDEACVHAGPNKSVISGKYLCEEYDGWPTREVHC